MGARGRRADAGRLVRSPRGRSGCRWSAARSARSGSASPRRPSLVATNGSRRPIRGPGAGRVAADGRGAAATGTGSGWRPGEPGLLRTPLLPRRRGDLRAVGVTVRVPGPLGLAVAAGHPSGAGHGPGAAALRLPQAPARAGWPGCATSTAGRRSGCAARAPSSTRCGSTSAATTSGRSTGGPPPGRRDVVVRTWQPERDRRVVLVLDTSRMSAGRVDDVPRLDSAMDAALLLAALAARAGDRVDFLAGDRRVRSRLRSAGGRDVRRHLQEAMADLEPVIAEADWSALAGAVTGLGRRHALVVLLTPWSRPPSRRGCCRCCPTLTRRHRVVLASVRDPALDRLARPPRRPRRRCTTPPPPSRCCTAGGGTAELLRRPRGPRGRRRRRAAAARPGRPLPRPEGPRAALERRLAGLDTATPGWRPGPPGADGVEVTGVRRGALRRPAEDEHVGEEHRLGERRRSRPAPRWAGRRASRRPR